MLTGIINKKILKKEIKHKRKNFVLLDYIERDELECLFENSYAFIYPSLNEGFGYPPLSAMKYGVPVITSGSSSIPEVCGNAAIYFDPYSIYEIKNRILQLSDKEIYNECSKKWARKICLYK
ncbi:MAG: glycosyltransferase [Treponema succinifaciens]|nr:MAG: glycosyltransferase [Treponema succinifaciens]